MKKGQGQFWNKEKSEKIDWLFIYKCMAIDISFKFSVFLCSSSPKWGSDSSDTIVVFVLSNSNMTNSFCPSRSMCDGT